MIKNDLNLIEKCLQKKEQKKLIMVAPSFLTDFSYPEIICQMRNLGFDKVVEITFGAKIINKEYHRLLSERKEKLWISSTCPGIVESIKRSEDLKIFEENIAPIDSPMKAMSKVCKKYYPEHKIFFLSPCHMKKLEAEKIKEIDFVIDYQQMKNLLKKYSIGHCHTNRKFDKFYNDYTKIYPLSGGLTKTAHLKGILKKREVVIKDGWEKVKKILLKIKKKPKKYRKIKFLDVTFCYGGCIGGPCTSREISIWRKKRLVQKYRKNSLKEAIPEDRKGLLEKAAGLKFSNF
ncbi:MAG: [Fe-Fe] hydrogenase large subunit C-terminal domain-containing protein [Candidatus Pacearchaeota archaeon]